MKKINRKLVLSMLVIIIAYSMMFSAIHSKNDTTYVSARGKKATILIDPGHGGMDGGGVSANGILEKNITLEIAQKLKTRLNSMGYNVVMTREKDEGLYSNEKTVKSKKVADLKKRVLIKQESGCDMFISIHTNKFPQTQYFGAEIYYSKRDDSKILAQTIMNKFKEGIDDGNRRGIKAANDAFMILRDNDNMPGIIIECGFLSNPKEEKKLRDPEYQHKLCKLISKGVEEYLKDK